MENYNTEPSGPVILQNTTKFGTPTTISQMQTSQSSSSTNSTQGSPLTIKIEEQENGETRVSRAPTPPLAPQPPPPRMTTPRRATPRNTQDVGETTFGLQTSPPYQAPHEWEKAQRKEPARQEHDQLSWTACYDRGCRTNFRDKEALGWFPQERSRSMPSVPIWHRNNKQKGEAPERHHVGQMLRGRMICPCPRENKRRVLPPGKRRKKNSVEMAPETPRARATKEVRCREDPAGEAAERKNPTRRRSLTKAGPGSDGRKGPIPEKQGRIPTKDNGPAKHDKLNPRRNSRTLQNGCGSWLQPGKVEKRN